MSRALRHLCCALALACAPAMAQQASDFASTALAVQASRLLVSGRPDQAYRQLAAAEIDHAGDPDFDALLGVAALDAGEATDAVIALSRATLIRPDDLGLRIDLGRALFASGDLAGARIEFDQLADAGAPPEAAAVIASYRREIDRLSARYQRRWSARLGLESGFDSNANAATEALSFLGFELDEVSRSTESPFYGSLIEISRRAPLAPRWQYAIDASAGLREYPDAEFVSNSRAGARLGVEYRRARSSLRLAVGGDRTDVDGDENSTASGLDLGYRRQLGLHWEFALDVRAAAIRYADALAFRDVDQVLLAPGLRRRLDLARGGQLSLGAVLGQDATTADDPAYDRDLFGASVAISLGISQRWQMVASGSWSQSDYGANPFLADAQALGESISPERSEDLTQAALGFNFTDPRWPRWLLEIGARYARNQGDIALYDFERGSARLALTRSFQ